jgi:hypothetical protein
MIWPTLDFNNGAKLTKPEAHSIRAEAGVFRCSPLLLWSLQRS